MKKNVYNYVTCLKKNIIKLTKHNTNEKNKKFVLITCSHFILYILTKFKNDIFFLHK